MENKLGTDLSEDGGAPAAVTDKASVPPPGVHV